MAAIEPSTPHRSHGGFLSGRGRGHLSPAFFMLRPLSLSILSRARLAACLPRGLLAVSVYFGKSREVPSYLGMTQNFQSSRNFPIGYAVAANEIRKSIENSECHIPWKIHRHMIQILVRNSSARTEFSSGRPPRVSERRKFRPIRARKIGKSILTGKNAFTINPP